MNMNIQNGEELKRKNRVYVPEILEQLCLRMTMIYDMMPYSVKNNFLLPVVDEGTSVNMSTIDSHQCVTMAINANYAASHLYFVNVSQLDLFSSICP